MVPKWGHYVPLASDESCPACRENCHARNGKRLKVPLTEVGNIVRTRAVALTMAVLLGFLSCLLIIAIVVLVFIGPLWNFQDDFLMSNRACKNPPIRREWRALLEPEKQDYIRAVKCLATVPSVIKEQGSVWDP